jgi:hypothetical protein
MSTTATVINLGYATVIGAFGIALIRISTRRRPSEAERAAAASKRVGLRVWDLATEKWVDLPYGVKPAPGQVTSREITNGDPLELLYRSPAYDRAAAAIDEGLSRLFEELGPPPTVEEGLAELRAAIRDEQQKGDPA